MLTRPATRNASALKRAINEQYWHGHTDYTLDPIVVVDERGEPIGRIRDGDSVIFCCRRGEREIQLTEAFADLDFDRFPRPSFRDLNFSILTLYHEKFNGLPVAFAPVSIHNTLAEAVSRAGLRQVHIAESEKFAHVTYFLNGGNSLPFPGEEDTRIPSPHGRPFEQVPELSLAAVVEQVLAATRQHVEFIVVNFANGDVIGHTANDEAKVRCASLVDAHLGNAIDAAAAEGYVVLVTADHGNLELMRHPDGTPHVAHTANPVPFVLIDPASHCVDCVRDGTLADVAPTVLSALAIGAAPDMNGSTLTPGHPWGGQRRVLLMILDGWGIGRQDNSNPIFLASTPRWDQLLQRYAHSRLQASGAAVGLENGKPGNSEAGHMNIGAGRMIPQDDVRLDAAMRDGTFYTNGVLLHSITRTREQGRALHLIGLLSEKSSHGSIEYPLAILRMAKQAGLEHAYLHLIFDGRSTEPGSAPALLDMLEERMQQIGLGEIATGTGRGIALDRDGDYGKTRRAFEAMVHGIGNRIQGN